MACAVVNGQRVAYDYTGGDGSPIVLAHGFLMDRTMFAAQVEALAPEFRVITWDDAALVTRCRTDSPSRTGIQRVTAWHCWHTSGSSERWSATPKTQE